MSNTECLIHSKKVGHAASIAVRKYADEKFVRIHLYVDNNTPDVYMVEDKTFDEVVSLVDAGRFTYVPPQPARLIMEW